MVSAGSRLFFGQGEAVSKAHHRHGPSASSATGDACAFPAAGALTEEDWIRFADAWTGEYAKHQARASSEKRRLMAAVK